MSRAIPWSRENFKPNDVYLSNHYLLEISPFTPDNEQFKQKDDDKPPTAAEVLKTPDEGLEATEDKETLVYDMATTAEDLELLGFVIMESTKEREIAKFYHSCQNEQKANKITNDESQNGKILETGWQKRAQKRNREPESEEDLVNLANSTKALSSTKDESVTKIEDLATISETKIFNKKFITKTGDLPTTSTSLPNTEDHVTEDTTTSVETILSCNAEDFFSNPEDFLSNTEDLFSNAEDFLSGMDEMTTSPEDFSPDMERCQLELVKEQCKVFDKLMEENRLLTQELIKLSTLPRTRGTVAEISKGLKMINELSRKMRNCTTSSLLNLTPI